MTAEANYANSLAIVGMSGRFPDANTVGDLWNNLRTGSKSLRHYSDGELLERNVSEALLAHDQYVKAGMELADFDQFDAAFFGFSPREAETMDPQVRLFLQCAWAAFEDAAYDLSSYEGLVGVFAGKHPSTYLVQNLMANPEMAGLASPLQISSGNDADALANMISYKFNLTGPAVAVQSFCSTSLVATHLACQSLLNYECDMALAGGVAIQLPHRSGYLFQEGGILSPDGECRSFDANANGSVLGSGVGTVVIKRLSDAQEDGDNIYAVIRGSAINNDGSTRVSFGAPGVNGQASVILEAMSVAGVEPESIGYIATHGTGTVMGDAVEIEAMKQAFEQGLGSEGKQFCAIGSIKPNIGHLDRASGIANLISAALAVKHNSRPPSLNFAQPNPELGLPDSPFYVNTELSQWPDTTAWPRRAGVNSFGLGGTNAHVVIEEAPVAQPGSGSRRLQLLMLSAKTESALEIASSNLADYLRDNRDIALADVAHTLQRGRTALAHRRVVLCHDHQSAIDALSSGDPQAVWSFKPSGEVAQVSFLLAGVGDQYDGMAADLYLTEPVFRETVDYCCDYLEGPLGVDLRDWMQPAEGGGQQDGVSLRAMLGREEVSAEPPTQPTSIAQPLVFVIEYALAQMLKSWGITPVNMIGYSLGEYVAACLANVLPLDDALHIVAKRAQLIDTVTAGSMLTVSLSEKALQPYLSEATSIGGVLSDSALVVSGSPDAIDALQATLLAAEISCQKLQTSHAFHSPMMKAIQQELIGLFASIKLSAPRIPYISNVTGDWISDEQATSPAYWGQHLCEAVQFADGIGRILDANHSTLIELGVGQSLSAFARQHPAFVANTQVVPTLRYRYDNQLDDQFLLSTLGKLWLSGVSLDWDGFYANEQRRRVSLPSYPFEGVRYWVDAGSNPANLTQALDEGKRADIGQWFYQPMWEQTATWRHTDRWDAADESTTWLVFVDDSGFGARFVKRLTALGHDVTVVQKGPRFALIERNVYSVNPQAPSDYERLLAQIPALPSHIAHLWAIDPCAESGSTTERFADAQRQGLYPFLFLLQAATALYTDSLEIWVLSDQAQSVTGGELYCAEKAPLLGLCRVAGQENVNVACHLVDIDWAANGAVLGDWFVDQLSAEIRHPSLELGIAYRGHSRWTQQFRPMQLAPTTQPVLRQQGTFLITGGLGDVGMLLIQHMATATQGTIIVTSRGLFPARDEWDDYLTANQDQHNRKCAAIAVFKMLEEQGSSIVVVQADVGNQKAMQTVVTTIEAEHGTLSGVLHAAGISGDDYFQPLQQLTPQEFETHFQPKAYGLYALEQALAGRDLDFCVMFSSLSSILGGLRFGAYTAANLFIDAFVTQHNRRSAQWWSCINWDTWQTRADQHEKFGLTVAQYEMLPKEALQVLETVIDNQPLLQVVNSTGNLEQRLDQWVRQVGLPDEFEGQTVTYDRPILSTAYVAPSNEIEEEIVDIWQSLLAIEPVGIHDNFIELGGHSLMAMQVIARLRQAFSINLGLATALLAPTAAELAVAVELAIIEQIDDLSIAEMSDLIEA